MFSSQLIFSLVSLLVVSRVSVIEAQNLTDGYEYTDQIQRALLSLYPIDLSNLMPNLPIDNTTSASSKKCYEQVSILVNSTRNGAMWALQMIDASSKLPSGILMGNHVDLGMYDECVGIRENANGEEIRGRHCMYNVNASFGAASLQETLSICLPSSCGSKDVEIMLEAALEMIKNIVEMEIPITIEGATCSSLEPPDWTPGGIVTLFGLSLLLLFLVICTISDLYAKRSKFAFSSYPRLVWLREFSLYSNAVRILSTKTTPQTLPAIQGIRFFSMCWVIFGHEYFMGLLSAMINPLKVLQWVHTWNAVYMIIAPFAVDTFFTISGFLLSYLFLKEMSTGRRFNIFTYYIHRYLRLTPALAALLLMTIFVLPRVGSGAFWDTGMNTVVTNCRKNWWPMLLYVHNYVDKKHLWCLAHTWYLAVEMHFFWVSPLILYPLAKKPRIGLAILAVAFVASVVTPAVISYKHKYSGGLFAAGDLAVATRANMNFYMESHLRAAPWLIGIFFGYLVFEKQGTPRKLTKRIGWICTVIAFAFCFFSSRVFQADGYVYNTTWETFYIVVSKPLWSGGVAWIIYASIRGFGGPIKTVLSFPIYTPFSRISYCVYLVHFIIQLMRSMSTRVPRYFDDFNCFSEFLIDAVLSIVFGFFFTLIFESPILTLEKIIKRHGRRRREESGDRHGLDKAENGVDNPAMARD